MFQCVKKRFDNGMLYWYILMMIDENNFITKKEKTSLEAELKELKEVKRVEIIEQLKVARSYGDLSENSEYETARKKQAILEAKILEIEARLKVSTVKSVDHRVEKVTIGNSVKVKVDEKETKTFDVGVEGDNVKISPHSPIALGLLGKEVGDICFIKLPSKTLKMEVKNIS